MEILDVVTSSVFIAPFTLIILAMMWAVILHKLPVIWAWVASALTFMLTASVYVWLILR